MNILKITERGWAGHFCAASSCEFKRNTLIEYGRKKVVVSTVGNYIPQHKNKADTIGYNRYYETMVFRAIKKGVYWEANIYKQIDFDSNWALDYLTENADKDANDMHEVVVKEMSKRLKTKGRPKR